MRGEHRWGSLRLKRAQADRAEQIGTLNVDLAGEIKRANDLAAAEKQAQELNRIATSVPTPCGVTDIHVYDGCKKRMVKYAAMRDYKIYLYDKGQHTQSEIAYVKANTEDKYVPSGYEPYFNWQKTRELVVYDSKTRILLVKKGHIEAR